MMSAAITGPQLRALQTLAARVFSELSGEEERAARLAWASQELGHTVTSFRELSADEAGRLIGLLKVSLGQPLAPRRRRPRELAHAAGTHGRKGVVISVEVMASEADRATVDDLRQRAGMSAESFANWLGSSRTSPTRGRRDLRTLADCNRARWALKSMLRRAG